MLYLNNQLVNILIIGLIVFSFFQYYSILKLTVLIVFFFNYINNYYLQSNITLKIPITLIYGLNNIHPYLFYCSFLFLLVLIISKFLIKTNGSVIVLHFFSLIALYTGML